MLTPSYVEVPRPISSRITRLRPVACRRIAAVSAISTMNVERPPLRSSCAPIRVKIRSHTPMVASVRGDVRSDLSEQHDARRLAKVGRLARHVRAGEHDDARLVVEVHVIGDEPARTERALHQRVAATDDAQTSTTRRRRAHPVLFLGDGGERLRHVQGRDRGGGVGERRGRRSPRRAAAPASNSCSRAIARSRAWSTIASCSLRSGVTKRSAPARVCLRE